MTGAPARDRFIDLLRATVRDGTLVRLTLARHRGADASLKNLLVRPVTLKAGPRLGFVWRHATRDIAKNHPPPEGLALLEPLIGGDFLDAHLFTTAQVAQLECQPDGRTRLDLKEAPAESVSASAHDRAKEHPVAAGAPWLRALGVTNDQGRPREGMSAKFRQIQKFAEMIVHLVGAEDASIPLQIVDMGSGKGYLTFAVSEVLGERARVRGVEQRPELVELCNRVAREEGFAPRLQFTAGTIADTEFGAARSEKPPIDMLIALHACDTATDDALAKGIAAGAKFLVVAPCCQKEVRSQLAAPPILAEAFRHGIFQERQAEFATDALRAQLLEWAGYRTRVFEFISTEHTAKNLMISAVKGRPAGDPAVADGIRQFAAFYGIRHQALAAHLGFDLR